MSVVYGILSGMVILLLLGLLSLGLAVGAATINTTLTGLSAKKTYYIRVRTYKTVNGTKYYSGWSTVKSQKTK